jgi:succinate-semialdehyde dehydrogenase/glutarate-semialdehyde dehydrogenase
MIQPINPATGEKLATYAGTSSAEIDDILQKAGQEFLRWRRTGFSDRAAKMRMAAAILRDRSDEFARLMALEMGKPLAQGKAEAEKCAWVCEYFAENAEKLLAPQPVQTDAHRSLVTFEPLGVILAVMPWNFPFWQVFRFAAPALMSGNAAVLKHASNVPGCALAIEQIFRDAGFPENLFSALLIDSSQVSELIENPIIKAVTLTGSVNAGRAIAKKAGEMLKKTVLELGGSDPYVILEDADVESAAQICAQSRLINSGQSCIAAKRFIVVQPVHERFEQAFVREMKKQIIGDPLADGVTVGPLARFDLREQLHDQVQRSVKAGARLCLGGEIPGSAGAFYPPTVLADVEKGMAAFDEETFGPVAAIINARDEAQALELANDSSFGLGAAVFTRDRERGERIAKHDLEAGSCFVNALVKSDPRLPFGGIKESGYGRELSAFGIRELVNIKTVYVA